VELERRVRRFRAGRAPLSLAGRVAIVVDDGIATGGTVRAAMAAVRARGAAELVLAVPVAAIATLAELEGFADASVCVAPVRSLGAIGAFYDDFRQVDDDEVARLLAIARQSAEKATTSRAADDAGRAAMTRRTR
jgi:putative phosphoribosyl transferase